MKFSKFSNPLFYTKLLNRLLRYLQYPKLGMNHSRDFIIRELYFCSQEPWGFTVFHWLFLLLLVTSLLKIWKWIMFSLLFFVDEVSPPPATEDCDSTEFRCTDGTCIDRSLLCDQHYHCPDGSDEDDCGESRRSYRVVSSYVMFWCHFFMMYYVMSVCCLYSYFWVHHLILLNQEPKPSGCEEKEFQCEDGACIDHELICNHAYDCHDGSDESECSEFQKFQISFHDMYSLLAFHHIIKTLDVEVCWCKQTLKQWNTYQSWIVERIF